MASVNSFLGSKVGVYIISNNEFDKLNVSKSNTNILSGVKGLPNNSMIFVNTGSLYKLFVTDNNGEALPVVTSEITTNNSYYYNSYYDNSYSYSYLMNSYSYSYSYSHIR